MKFVALVVLALQWGQSQAGPLADCGTQWGEKAWVFDFQKTYSEYESTIQRAQCVKDWSIFIFMEANNNLYPYALWDLFDLEAVFFKQGIAASTAKSDVIVEVNGLDPEIRRLHLFSGPVKYRRHSISDFSGLNLDSVRSPVVEKLSKSQPTGERFANFLLWAQKKYPARNYMIIVWGHGEGWRSSFSSPTDFGGIGFEQTSQTWMDIPTLRSALAQFSLVIEKPVDVYISDACMMQMLEVAYEISPFARFVAGSAQVQNFRGLPYRRLLMEINRGNFAGLANRLGSPDEAWMIAKMLPALVEKSLRSKTGELWQDPETYAYLSSSSLISSELQNLLIPEIKALAQILKDYLAERPERAAGLLKIARAIPAIPGGAQDFGMFLGFAELLVSDEIKSQAATDLSFSLREQLVQVSTMLGRSEGAYAYGTGFGLGEQSQTQGFLPRAVSLWLPLSAEEYRSRQADFRQSRFEQMTGWSEWLELLFTPNFKTDP